VFWLLSFFVFKFQICTHFLFTRFCFLYRALVVFCRLFLRLFLEEDVSKLLFAISMDLEWNSDETGEERFVPGKVLWSFITGNCRTHLFSQDGQNTAHFIHQFPKLNLAAHVQPIIHTAMRVNLQHHQTFNGRTSFTDTRSHFGIMMLILFFITSTLCLMSSTLTGTTRWVSRCQSMSIATCSVR
jgi:hypothetical protein